MIGILGAPNLWRSVRFALDGDWPFERLLVPEVDDPAVQISVGSPVGRALATAAVGDEVTVDAPGGCVVVKVLAVS